MLQVSPGSEATCTITADLARARVGGASAGLGAAPSRVVLAVVLHPHSADPSDGGDGHPRVVSMTTVELLPLCTSSDRVLHPAHPHHHFTVLFYSRFPLLVWGALVVNSLRGDLLDPTLSVIVHFVCRTGTC